METPGEGSGTRTVRTGRVRRKGTVRKGTLQAFVGAYNEAIEMINADPDSFLELFYEKANVAPALQGRYSVPSYTPDCVPSPEDVERIEAFMVKKGLLDRPFSYEEMVVSSPEAEQ